MYAHAKDISLSSYEDGCPDEYMDSCKAVSGVLRISMALTIFFGIQGLGTFINARFYDSLWILKLCGFFALVIGLFFAPSSAFGTGGYAWFARITGFMYLILQQVILLDLAYTWNERWVEYATNSEGEKGNKWLLGLLLISSLLFAVGFTVIGLLFWQFKDCDNNLVIISLTLALCVLASLIQLFVSDGEGSVLTSAIMTAYSSYITYSAVILNPDETCNPTLHSGYQTLSAVSTPCTPSYHPFHPLIPLLLQIIGLALLTVSIVWTTYNTVKKIPQITDKTTGESITITNVAAPAASGDPYEMPVLRQLLAQVSLVFLLVAGYYAMILTNWATFQSSADIYDPRTGTSTMWIQASGQWIAIAFYLWSLVAPKVLSGRDFA